MPLHSHLAAPVSAQNLLAMLSGHPELARDGSYDLAAAHRPRKEALSEAGSEGTVAREEHNPFLGEEESPLHHQASRGELNEQDKKVCDLAPFRAFCVDSMRDWRHIN